MPNCLAAAGPQNNTRASAAFHTGYKRIESINARIRRAVNTRGHFPTEQGALKRVYLAIMSLDPKGTGQKRWSNRWKAALNTFDITFAGRLSAGRR